MKNNATNLLSIALMQRYQIKIIASCDHDHDIVTTIERYYSEIGE